MSTTPGLRSEIEQHWRDNGWDLKFLKSFMMSNVEPDPAGDVLTVPGGLEVEPDLTLNPPPPAPAVPPPPGYITEAELNERLAKARQEEKDKLYPRISTMEEELKKINAERDKETKAQTAAREKAEAEAKAKAEEEMSAKDLLLQKEQEWQQQISALRSEQEKDRALLEMERQFAALESYKTQALAQSADQIMPELRDLVGGASQEEIDQSIANAIAKTDAILANVTAHRQQERQQQRGASVTSPPVGPLENAPAYETITVDDLRNMDMATYAKNRHKLLNLARPGGTAQ